VAAQTGLCGESYTRPPAVANHGPGGHLSEAPAQSARGGPDLTYIRLQSGFVYLVAVMDWFSRDVLAWAVSITLDVPFGLEALEQALDRGRPEIFNTDQGAQFTSEAFTARLQKGGVQISMDGRGRALDNVFVERLWRSVKYEEVYLRDYKTVWDARHGLARYFALYNGERLHQALAYRTPAEVYGG
jgi:putative transposase